MNILRGIAAGCLLLSAVACKQTNKADRVAGTTDTGFYHEQYRLQAHFSPKEKWMNDPNGLVYYKNTYHMFFQHFPDSTVWGPMHWGHATSKDLIHWQQQPIALFPDSLGYIFSGSVVVDEKNTSGFGTKDNPPMVAIFTHHDPKGEKAGSSTFQNQSIAYSIDEGKTWTKYKSNPVLINPGIKDFRDPKVFWYAPQNKWVMSLATLDRITFYSSTDLKTWKKESEFGQKLGAHGGVWECPDLISLKLNGKEYWVLLVSINPGGPNKGSATQCFVGQFDGSKFTPNNTQTKWIDYGPDDYAGVTWSNTGDRKIFLGWMGNWIYANQVPTVKWRNAMTIPRELSLKLERNDIWLASKPVEELDEITEKTAKINAGELAKESDIFAIIKQRPKQFKLKFSTDELKEYSIVLANDAGEKLIIGYDIHNNGYYVNRINAGQKDFSKEFASISYAPRIAAGKFADIEMVVDASSIEVFADGGLSNLTGVFFPSQPFTHLSIANSGMAIRNLEIKSLRSIW
jgi:fructan beta-fructosidase